MRLSYRSPATFALLLCSMFASMFAIAQQSAYKDAALPVEDRVMDLLHRMTLEEKAAQLGSTWQNPQIMSDPKQREKLAFIDENGKLLPEKAKELLKNGLGEYVRPSEKRGPAEMVEFANTIQKLVIESNRLGIPVLFHDECLHGHAAPQGTSFPVPIALASSWDPALIHRVFSAVAEEVRARGVQQCLMPVLDLARDPRWGRTEETYGEDPYLVSRMGVAAVTGLQGTASALDDRHVFATVKHFAVHGQPEAGINIGPANYSERVIRDNWLVPFEAAVKEGRPASLMPSYNEVDGVPSHANKWLIQKILRGEWDWNGFIVSDYFAIAEMNRVHHLVGSNAEAGKLALETGVDIELPQTDAYSTLVEMVHNGRIPEELVDRSAARVLRAKFLAGLFDHPYADPARAKQVTNSPEHQQLALETARRSIILLKNDKDLLPLDRTRLKKVAVIGPNAAEVHLGGYSDKPGRGVSVLEGVRAKLKNIATVEYSQGAAITEGPAVWEQDTVVPPDEKKDAVRIRQAVALARHSDLVVLVLGENEQTSREAWAPNHLGDRDDLNLIGRQQQLADEVIATGKPVVVVLLHGRPNSIAKLARSAPAILDGWYLGQEGGTAIADVLFGDVNPGGKLPITVPRSVGQLPDFYNHKPSAHARPYVFAESEPLFPFGFGLSYTTFRLGQPRLSASTISPSGHATVEVDVTNTGKRAGDEVVQMYIHDEISSVTRPVKELKNFERLSLKPGESRTVRFEITPEKLWFTNIDMKRVVEPGTFQIMVGTDSTKTQDVILTVQ